MELLGALIAQIRWFVLLIVAMMFRKPIIELISRVISGEFSAFELSVLGNRIKLALIGFRGGEAGPWRAKDGWCEGEGGSS